MLLRFVAVVTAASGLWLILSRWFDYQTAPQLLSETANVAGLWFTVFAGAMMLVPILKVGVAIGLWRIFRWARIASIMVLSADFFLLGTSIVRFHFAASNTSRVVEYSVPGATHVETHSMWPTYIVATLSLLCLLALKKSVVQKQLEV